MRVAWVWAATPRVPSRHTAYTCVYLRIRAQLSCVPATLLRAARLIEQLNEFDFVLHVGDFSAWRTRVSITRYACMRAVGGVLSGWAALTQATRTTASQATTKRGTCALALALAVGKTHPPTQVCVVTV